MCAGESHSQCVQVSLRQLWTSVWLDESLPVVDSLLDDLNQQLIHLKDLEPACRQVRQFTCLSVHVSVCLTVYLSDCPPVCLQALLCVLHQDLVLQYVKRMMKTRTKSREQQVGGAQRMTEDARKITDFFSEGVRLYLRSWSLLILVSPGNQDPHSMRLCPQGCTETRWLGEMFCSLAEVLRLQDPGSVQLELVSLARRFPDLR